MLDRLRSISDHDALMKEVKKVEREKLIQIVHSKFKHRGARKCKKEVLILMVADRADAVFFSPIDNDTFSKVFGLFGPAVFASMTAYLFAQFIDIRIFHFLKEQTNGKHFWLRNNFSTLFSQIIDTASVLILLCVASDLGWSTGLSWERFLPLFVSSYIFKAGVALIDTPIAYFICALLRKKYNLKLGETIG